jgi:predicted unusual protein kinase regulating ubiquinone biosynthesis (AarF/ABC1/UbiB family)
MPTLIQVSSAAYLCLSDDVVAIIFSRVDSLVSKGNLLKVIMPPKTRGQGRAASTTATDVAENDVMLGYLDFGLLATIPETVRDALVCSVAQLVFARNIDAMARLFIDLQLLPPHRAILFDSDPVERAVFAQALNETFDKVLQFPDKNSSSTSSSPSSIVPILRFDNLLGGLTSLVARFEFQLPPYFLNNARALATLEGVARRLDPTFNVLQIMYPFALNRLLNNPSRSPIVDDTLMSLLRSPATKTIEMHRIRKLLDDSALLTGYSRRRVLQDVVASKGGRRTIRKVLRELLVSRFTSSRQATRGMEGRTFVAKHRIFRL